MPSWSATHEFLRHRFRIEELDTTTPQQLALTFVTQLTPGRNEAQRIICQHETYDQESWLLARADACAETSMEPSIAVTLAAQLRIGAVVLAGGTYEVRRAFALRNLVLDELARDLQYLAMESAFVRVKASPLPDQPELSDTSGRASSPASSAAEPTAVDAEPASTPPSSQPGGQWAD